MSLLAVPGKQMASTGKQCAAARATMNNNTKP